MPSSSTARYDRVRTPGLGAGWARLVVFPSWDEASEVSSQHHGVDGG